MAFEPFQNTLTTLREVHIPPDLADDKRAAFVKQIEAAVRQQAALAQSCDAILQPTGQVREEGGVLLIEHESVTPFDLDAILSAEERPDPATLWWITWCALRALAAVESKRVIHGGLQLRSLFVDRLGRVKLTDFGLASAVEIVCGRDVRRQVVCDAASDEQTAERGLSGSWVVLGEEADRENGWIAPYFAPEILAGGLRLNPTSDQFALGVVLYQIAAGVHPLGAELSDPELFGYFVPEPYPLEDERADWAEAFDRQQRDAAMRADQPVLDWAELVYRLLANEPGERFASFAAAEEAARQHVPPAWPEALRVLGESVELLAQEQYDPFLTSVGPWCENQELPALWRARLADYIADIEKFKAVAAARKAVESRLEQGFVALERGELEEARAIAREVADSPAAADKLRERVAELEQLCDEYEELITQRAEELAKANLESARETLARGEFPEARLILTGLLDDPLTRAPQREEAETLLAGIDEREKRHARQQAEFETVKNEFDEGDVTAALTRLTTLLDDPSLPDTLRRDAETLLKDVEVAKQRHDEYLQIINEVEAALERADLPAAEETLATLPFDSRDPQIVTRRSELAGSCDQLRQLLQRRDAAEGHLRKGEAQAALDQAQQLFEEELSPTVREQIVDLADRCRRVIRQIEQAQLDDALESLAEAEKAFQRGDVERCRRLLSTVLPLSSALDEADRTHVAKLDADCLRSEDAIRRIETAERRLGQEEFDAALAELDSIEARGLPGLVTERLADLRARTKQAHEEYQQRRAQELWAWLEQIADHLARGKVVQADGLRRKTEIPPDAGRELRDRFERLGDEVLRGRRILKSFAAVETALRDGTLDQATQLLDELAEPATADAAAAELPSWAVERVSQLRQGLAELEEAQRQQAVQEAQAALDEASKALDAADHAVAANRLAQAKEARHLSPELEARYDELTKAAAELERWMPKLASVETALREDRVADAQRDALAFLEQAPLPPPVEKRLRSAESQAGERIAARRQDLTAQLEALASMLEQRGRRARTFPQRVEAVRSDPLATPEHQAKATELAQRFEALPQPRRARLPLMISAAAVVVFASAAGWYVMRRPAVPPDPGDGEVNRPVADDPRRTIAAALERIRAAYVQAVDQELAAGRTPKSWELYFDPPDAFATTLLARDESGESLMLEPEVRAEEIDGLELTATVRKRLFPPPPEPERGRVEPPVATGPEWPPALASGPRPQPSAGMLSSLFTSFVPPDTLADPNPPLWALARIVTQVVVSERSPKNTFTLRLDLKGGAGTVSGEFGLEIIADQWRPVEANAAELRGLFARTLTGVQARVEAAAAEIRQNYVDGKLEQAYQAHQQAGELQAAFELPELTRAAAQLRRAIERFPSRWENPGGYAESEKDADLGYPRSLTKDGRTLLLVNVAPDDPLWAEIEAANQVSPAGRDAAGYALSAETRKPPDKRQWYVFYIDADEWAEPVEGDARSYARERGANDLPTVDQWLLAALKLRDRQDARGFFGGAWEWCLKDGRSWVCGGCDAIHEEYLPWPGEGAQPGELWGWLNNPLVSQPRARGDGLAGIRTVLRLGS